MKKTMCEKTCGSTTETNETNCEKAAKLDALLVEIYATILRRNFFGSATIRFVVQDGIIQNIQWSMEKSVR